jgi:hypothetical protein
VPNASAKKKFPNFALASRSRAAISLASLSNPGVARLNHARLNAKLSSLLSEVEPSDADEGFRMAHVVDVARCLNLIADEVRGACLKHKPLNSAHEAYAVIAEELEEFWEHVRKRSESRITQCMAEELIQTAAMCVRAIADLKLLPPLMKEGT